MAIAPISHFIFRPLTWRVFQHLPPLLVLDSEQPSPHSLGPPEHQCLCQQLPGWLRRDVPKLGCPCPLNFGCEAASGPAQRLEHCSPVGISTGQTGLREKVMTLKSWQYRDVKDEKSFAQLPTSLMSSDCPAV